MKESSRLRGNGFTLVQLLVVIRHIAIFITMLFPARRRAREQTRLDGVWMNASIGTGRDVSAAANFTANVRNFYVGNTASGSPPNMQSGILNLGVNNTITAATECRIGRSDNQPMSPAAWSRRPPTVRPR